MYYLLLNVPQFQKIHQQICNKIGIDWQFDLSFTQYMNFLMPFLSIVAILKAINKEKIEGNSQAMTDKWSFAHFTSGVIAQKVLKNSDKALLGHMIWEVYEKSGTFRLLYKYFPKWLNQLFE